MNYLEEFKKRSDEMLRAKAIVKQYSDDLEKLDRDIAELAKRTEKEFSFELDKELSDKREFRPKAKRRFDELQKKHEFEMRQQASQVSPFVERYAKEILDNDKELAKAYDSAEATLLKAYELVKVYESKRDELAEQVIADIKKTGYAEAMNGVADNYLDPYRIKNASPTKINLNAKNITGNISVEQFFEELEK